MSSCPSYGDVPQPGVLCSVLKLLVKSAGEDQDETEGQQLTQNLKMKKVGIELDSRERRKVQGGDISYFMPYAYWFKSAFKEYI